MSTEPNDVLEQNVSTLLESGGEPPKIADAARARIRDELVEKFGAKPVARSRVRTPIIAAGIGLVAMAAAVLIVLRFVGGEHGDKLADGTTFITEPGGKVVVLGPRRVRVEGAALLDVAPGEGTFIVETARGTIEVLGTRFLVDGEAQRTVTAVVRGKVKLSTDHGTIVLHAGEQGVAEAGRPPVRGPAPRLSHLVSWAQQARRRAEKDLAPIRHGTLFARDPGVRPDGHFGEEYPLPLKQLTVDVVVEDQVARIALDQTFHNPQNRTLEGVYKFAIPPDAALQRLAMYVDGKLTESAVVERMRARRIYEELVYRRIDPALLEYAGTGRLNLRVYPLLPQQDKRLMVAYTQSLPKLYTDWTLAIPMPEVDQPVGELVMTTRIKGCANCELTSPSHAISVERSGEDAVVRYRRAGDKIGDAFVIHVRDARRQTTVATKTEGSDRYVMVRAPVELGNAPREYRPRTWVILDDVSASRSELELAAQADLVDAFLREVDEDDKIAIVAFDVAPRVKLAPTRVMNVDRRAVRRALKNEGGVGATDFDRALAQATQLLAGTKPDDAMIVYLGDGVITSGARTLDVLRSQLVGKAHFVGVGVGDGPDTQTLDGLAAATGGYATTIDLADDLGWRAFDLIAALHTSRVTGVSAKLVDASGALVPSTAYVPAQLADGEELELVAKLAGDGAPAAVELTGTRDGKPWQQRIALGAAHGGDAAYLPRLWAQHHIAARLLAKHEAVIVPPCTAKPATKTEAAVSCPTEAQLREQRDEAIRQEVVTLGKQYFLLSRHTSLLVLENDAMYAKYGVRKGAGDTWAPYAMPATIPVVAMPMSNVVPSDVADDAELFRTPMQIFYDANQYRVRQLEAQSNIVTIDALDSGGSIGLGHFGTIGHGSGRGIVDKETTRSSLGLATVPTTSAPREEAKGEEKLEKADRSVMQKVDLDTAAVSNPLASQPGEPAPILAKAKRRAISSAEVTLGLVGGEGRWHAGGGGLRNYGLAQLQLMRFTGPTDLAFDDLTAFVPALTPDAADMWREQLREAAGAAASFPIDDAAKQLLARARAQLAAGIYRWDNLEIAVDGSKRFGWHRETDTGLGESASYDGAAFVRRYLELGFDVTRPVSEDDVALSLAYLPVWIAEPAHYARWFTVKARGRDIVLATRTNGRETVAFVMSFDDQARLVSIADGKGAKLLEVTWGKTGPTAARVNGRKIDVGFTATAISDAPQWAHRNMQSSVVVELPMHLEAYWQGIIAKAPVGTPAWRHAQRQLLASAAALGNRAESYLAYDALHQHGGVELADLVLASGGIATSTTDAQFAAALAPLAKQPLARYLLAGRAYGKAPSPTKLVPPGHDGLLGALWTLRSSIAYMLANDTTAAAARLVALGDRAFALRMIGAAALALRYNAANADAIARVWDSLAVGDEKNIARYQAVMAYYNRGQYDEAAERLAKLVADLDLDAEPVQLVIGESLFSSSRRGPAGWAIAYAQWRDRVLAGTSYAHVMSLVSYAARNPADLSAVLARAAALAPDIEHKLEVAKTAVAHGQNAFAQSIIDPLLKTSPTRELYQLAATFAQQRNDPAAALAYLEKAQDAGADEAVDVATVRSELGQIITFARQLALQSTGAERARAVERAMLWGTRWRMIDPGNVEIDRQLGELLLAVGDKAGAWRQLSSMIERDPWSSTGYISVATTFEAQGRVFEALDFWQQAIVIDQTNPTPRLRKAQALFALGRTAEGEAMLEQITSRKWHDVWAGVVAQAQALKNRGKHP